MTRPIAAVSLLAALLGGPTPLDASSLPAHVVSDLAPERATEVAVALDLTDSAGAGEPLGVIEIPAVGVRGEILEGVDDVTIRRAVGHFPETPRPFEPGNMALAAHRTTHFAGLRDVRIGDPVFIHTADGAARYIVERTLVVEPDDVWVLDPTQGSWLTLVTCYPFDHAGTAPQRFVVQARVDVETTARR